MNKKLILWIASGLAVIAIVGIGIFGVVNAQTPTPTPEAGQGYGRGMRGGMTEKFSGMAEKFGGMLQNFGSKMMGRGADAFGKFGTHQEEMVKAFADKLGLTVDEVNTRLKAGETFAKIAESKGITTEKLPAFMKDVCAKALDAAVAAGKLTQEQADAIKTKMADTDWSEMWNGKGMGAAPKADQDWSGKMGMRGEMPGMKDSWMHDALLKAFADKLGLTVDAVTARLEAGETHAKIAESKGITGDAFTTLWKEIHTQVIAQAVTDGKLTQEQADAFKARLEKTGTPIWGEGSGKGGMMPFGGGRRGR